MDGRVVTAVTDQSVTPLAAVLLACLAEEVQKVTTPPRVTTLRPGAQIELLLSRYADECCDGLAWLRVASIYPSENFPDPDIGYSRCAPVQWAAVLEIGVARCAPTPDAQTLTPPDEWTALTLAILDDAAAMRRAVCCWTEVQKDTMYLVGAWTPMTVEGGCTGGSMLVTVAVGDCDCV